MYFSCCLFIATVLFPFVSAVLSKWKTETQHNAGLHAHVQKYNSIHVCSVHVTGMYALTKTMNRVDCHNSMFTCSVISIVQLALSSILLNHVVELNHRVEIICDLFRTSDIDCIETKYLSARKTRRKRK